MDLREVLAVIGAPLALTGVAMYFRDSATPSRPGSDRALTTMT
ncbi:hypothetical protein OTB20_23125 [Streptomyces sp. H27-H1]|nr:hypothetical protein [Streptomyces sp. H27-H1]MCY0929041.1 hypothetical protein [Streptomyces sp. H27-H1]